MFLSATEAHNRRNVNRSVAESLAEAGLVIAQARAAGKRCEARDLGRVRLPLRRSRRPPGGCSRWPASCATPGPPRSSFADTTGMANPAQVEAFFADARAGLGGDVELTAHFHNTRGAGLANAYAALRAGVASFEASFGELGGCPVPPGSTGNIATEDLVSMLDQLGIATGVDLPGLIECARRAEQLLGRKLGSHTLRSGPVNWP